MPASWKGTRASENSPFLSKKFLGNLYHWPLVTRNLEFLVTHLWIFYSRTATEHVGANMLQKILKKSQYWPRNEAKLSLTIKSTWSFRGGKTQFIPVLSNTKALVVFLRKDGIISRWGTKWKNTRKFHWREAGQRSDAPPSWLPCDVQQIRGPETSV